MSDVGINVTATFIQSYCLCNFVIISLERAYFRIVAKEYISKEKPHKTQELLWLWKLHPVFKKFDLAKMKLGNKNLLR